MTISKVLVANRGEIARRIFRTCRAMGISTVAVYSEPDDGEPHMLDADEAVLLPGSTAVETYLNIEKILEAARSTGAIAVHPGYGFLAENAEFARAVIDSDLIWIGPSPEAMEIMGSKIKSKRLMESVGVPTLESIELEGLATVKSAAITLGFPVIVKASAGGGGKGMRIVNDPDDLSDAISAAQREAASAFGDDTAFIEKYLQAPRHIEIQVFGDGKGNVISLHERECSIQRRHQKIIEESPSPVITEPTRQAMSGAAIKAAKAVNYSGAGTVEFLYQDGEFFFLEMNTRLQVEHPVTEMITGLDLVQIQIEIADGGALPEVPAIQGHAIEARLYAEDPVNDFLPVTGTFHQFQFDPTPGLRVDSGIEDGSEVSVFYDPMIAKVIAHGPTRQASASILSTALRQARIHGSATNRALLVRILEHPEFLEGATDTHFLERHDPTTLGMPLASTRDERLGALAAALADQAYERWKASVMKSIPSGWRNSRSQLAVRSYSGTHSEHHISYSVDSAEFTVDELRQVTVNEATPDAVDIEVGSEEHLFAVARNGDRRFIDSAAGPVEVLAMPRFPSIEGEDEAGSLHSPMPGKVLRLDVVVGEHVSEGQVLVVLEAMKMEHTLKSPHDGRVVEVRAGVDDQVEADQILVVVEN